MPKETNLGKRIALEFLDYLRFKVESDSLTVEEVDSIASKLDRMLEMFSAGRPANNKKKEE